MYAKHKITEKIEYKVKNVNKIENDSGDRLRAVVAARFTEESAAVKTDASPPGQKRRRCDRGVIGHYSN